MSRARRIKSPAVLARESRRSGQGRIWRTPATDYNSGPATTTGWGWRAEHGLADGEEIECECRSVAGVGSGQSRLTCVDAHPNHHKAENEKSRAEDSGHVISKAARTRAACGVWSIDVSDEICGPLERLVVRQSRLLGGATPDDAELFPRESGARGKVIAGQCAEPLTALKPKVQLHESLHSLEPVGLVRSQDNLAHVDGYPKGSADDDKREKAQSDFHGSLSSDEVVKARSNASHNISSNSDEAKGHGEDLAEGAHSALHLGGLALGLGKLGQSDCAVDVVEGQCQPFGLRKLDQLAGHIWGHTLLIRLVERDVALRNADASAQLGLADAQLVADQLDLVHAHIISATVSSVNSGAFCANTSRTNTLWR